MKRLLRDPRIQAALGALLGAYLRLVAATTRWRLVGGTDLAAPFLLACWHERLPLLPALHREARRRGIPAAAAPVHAVVSRHRDGRLLAALLRGHGIGLIDASSGRAGAAGLRGMLRALAAGGVVALTPDGPRGPARHAAPGVALAAALARVPVVPCAARTRWGFALASWDRMWIPLPGGRGTIVLGNPIAIPPDGAEAAQPAIAAALSACCDRADHAAPPVPLSGLAWAGLATALAPLLPAHLRRRAARGKEDPERLAERRGAGAARPPGPLLWLHAASVGETLSALPLLEALAARAPALRFLVTTGTVTAATLLPQRLAPGLAARVMHRYAPLDVPAWVGRFLDGWAPDAAVLVEQELWPNLLAALRDRGIPAALVNARMSARAAARWGWLPGLARHALGAFDLVAARSGADAARLVALGPPGVAGFGDLKLAAPPLPADPAALAALRAVIGDRPVWLAASTHPGEEAQVLAAHAALAPRFPGLLTIIAPRHPERGPAIAAAATPPLARRGAGALPGPADAVYLADTLGELGLFYRLAQAALVGGSLVPRGGQNPLEPARLGCPILLGPHVDNFAEPAARLLAAGGAIALSGPEALAGALATLLDDPARRAALAAAAAAVVADDADVAGRLAEAVLALLPPGFGAA